MAGAAGSTPKPRRRDRLLLPFRRRSPSPNPPTPSAAGATTNTSQSPSNTSSAITVLQSTSQRVVDRALQQLSERQRTILRPYLPASANSTVDAIEQCLAATRQEQQAWDDKRWTIAFGSRRITIKKAVDKTIRWLDRFKAVGDIAVNADPVHAGLPWAGIRLLLEVATADNAQMAALFIGCEIVMFMVNRLKAYLEFLSQMPATLTEANFEHALASMHALILAFLADALEKYQQPAFRRAFDALLYDSEVLKFERDCNQLANRLEMEASNCDRTLAEKDRRVLGQTYQDLQKALKDISQIHYVQATLERLEKKLDLSRLKTVEGASFGAYSPIHHSCHKETRVSLRRSIQEWAQQADGKSIFWLSGMAGTGKSTISWTVAEWLANQCIGSDVALGASFFFKRGERDQGSAALLFPTLAHQLAKKIDGLDVLLAKALDDDVDIGSRNKSLGEQFAKLIREPLRKLFAVQKRPRYVIVLDALDECDASDIATVVQLWSGLPEFANNCLRLFLTSRPDMPVLTGFDEISVTVHIDANLQDVPLPVVEEDIFVFLRSEFTDIRNKYNRRPWSGIPLDNDWPGDATIRELAEMATPLFIVAATMCLFIGDCHWDPRERLRMFLDHRRIGHLSPMAQTYLPILNQVATNLSDSAERDVIYHEFRVVVGSIVLLAEPLSRAALATLLGMRISTVTLRLQPLRSVLEIPDDVEAVVRPLHLSFGEYLTSPELRQEPFGVNGTATNTMLWRRCLQVLSGVGGLVENICRLDHPGQLRESVSSEHVNIHLPLALQYACRYWVHHIQLSGSRICDHDDVHVFLQAHFLHWLEALSFLDHLADAIGFTETLRTLVAVENSDIARFLDDAYRFVLTNRYVGEVAPLQLYSSAVIFAPRNSIVRKICGGQPAWILQNPLTPLTWGPELQKLEGHTGMVLAVAYSHDGSLLASASEDNTVRLWKPLTGQEVLRLEGHEGAVVTVAFSRDGLFLASASKDETIRLWNVVTGQEVWKFEGRVGVALVAFSYDGSLLASALEDDTVRLWSLSTGQEMKKFDGQTETHGRTQTCLDAVAFSHDGTLLISALYDRMVRLRDPWTSQEIRKFLAPAPGITCIALTYEGSLLALACTDRTVRLWKASTGEEVQTLEAHTNWVRTVAFSHDGSILASGLHDGAVRLWNLIGTQEGQLFEGHTNEVTGLAFSPDGSQLASASFDGTVRLWKPSIYQETVRLERHASWVATVVFSHDGSHLASVSHFGELWLWNSATGQKVQAFKEAKISKVAFSHNSLLLAAVSWDPPIIWLGNTPTGRQVLKLRGHIAWITAVAFSYDDLLLASASYDMTVRLWDLSTGLEVRKLEWPSRTSFPPGFGFLGADIKGFKISAVAIAFSRNGSLIALGANDHTVRLWDLGIEQEVRKLEGHTQSIDMVSFSEDGSFLASASWFDEILRWDLSTAREIRRFCGMRKVTQIKFTADGQALLTNRGSIRLSSTLDNSQDGEESPYGLMLKGQWIKYEGEPILWLPQEYRSAATAIFENQIAFGLKNGSVTLLRLNCEQAIAQK